MLAKARSQVHNSEDNPGGGAVRGKWALAAVGCGFVLFLPAAARAQDLPPGFDADLAAQFEAELRAILTENGVTGVSVDNLDEMIGEPGDLDLPPGEPLLLFASEEALRLAEGKVEGDGDSQLTGPCMGLTMSFDGAGNVIDMAADFDDAAPPIDMLEYYESKGTTVKAALTASNPYKVDVNGFVVYAGIAGGDGDGPRNHTWQITTFGTALDSGGDDNPDGNNRNSGGINMGKQLPPLVKVNALFKIEGDMSAPNGFECVGSGYFETVGADPLAQIVGGVLALLGGLGVLFNARPARTWRG